MNSSNRVGLREVAARAGVSLAAASLALRGRGALSSELVGRVRAAADELGYQPNPLLASLAAKRFSSAESVRGTPIAILAAGGGLGRAGSPGHYTRQLCQHAALLGYAPTIHEIGPATNFKSLNRTFYHQMVQGIIIVGSMPELNAVTEIDWNQYSVVQCGRYIAPLPFHIVRPNIFQAVKLVFSELLVRGYRRIGFALGRHDPPIEDDEARYGAAVAMESSYLTKRDQLPVYQGSFRDVKSVVAWIKKVRPDVVIGFHGGYIQLLREGGYRFPEDMGYAAMHLDGGTRDRGLSGLNQNLPEIARQSICLIDQLIRVRERGTSDKPMHVLISSSWVEGQTVRPRIPS